MCQAKWYVLVEGTAWSVWNFTIRLNIILINKLVDEFLFFKQTIENGPEESIDKENFDKIAYINNDLKNSNEER